MLITNKVDMQVAQTLSLFFISLVGLLVCSCAQKTSILKGDEELLFQKISDNSTVSAEGIWTINKEGVIIGSGGPGYLSTNTSYSNFILEAEFFPDNKVNSGIFIRCSSQTGSAADCYEMNIWDDHVNQEFRTGAIVTHGKPFEHINSVGKWNKYKIRSEGDRIQVWLNGRKTADLKDSKTAEGYIVLQVFDQGTIQFRNVKVRAL